MKLAVIGNGKIVQEFLPMVQNLPQIELKAIVGRSQSLEKLVALQEEFQIEAVFTDYSDCLNKADIDTVYVALPNNLHYVYAKEALEQGKNVICEKPFTLTLAEFMTLRKLAEEKQLVLVEAITNQYLNNYKKIQELAKDLGDLKLIECNYSQYSSRYDQFKQGEILPAFNPKMGGGALMDINIYNIHFVVGLLGKPLSVQYLANMERGIDTSGILILDYGETKVVCIGAKDSTSVISSTIQGNLGSIKVNGATNTLESFDLLDLKNHAQHYNENTQQHRMFQEFEIFAEVIQKNDLNFVKKQLDHSQAVMEIVSEALKSSGLELG